MANRETQTRREVKAALLGFLIGVVFIPGLNLLSTGMSIEGKQRVATVAAVLCGILFLGALVIEMKTRRAARPPIK